MNFNSLAGFAAFVTTSIAKVEHEKHHALDEAAKLVETEAKRVIGTYDYGWPQLAEATQADRERKGYAPNEPGLRSGEMRDSIDHVVDGNEAQIGSNDDHLVYFELGTKNQPPRSVLAGAAVSKETEIRDLLGKSMVPMLKTSP